MHQKNTKRALARAHYWWTSHQCHTTATFTVGIIAFLFVLSVAQDVGK